MKKSLLIISILSMLIGCSVETTVNYDSDSSKDNTSTTGGNTSGSGNNDTNDSDDGEKEIITEFREGVTLWEGTIDYNSWEENPGYSIKIDREMFQTFKAGDQIQITHEASTTFTEYYQLFFSGTIDNDWMDYTFFRGDSINCNPDPTEGLQPDRTNQTTAYTITEADLSNLKSQGLVIWGIGLVMKKLVFACETPIPFKLLGMHYQTNYTCTVNGTQKPVFLRFEKYEGPFSKNDGTNINGVFYLLRFYTWNDWVNTGYYGGFQNQNDLMEIYYDQTILSSTIPNDLKSEDSKFAVSYTKDLQTLTLRNINTNTVYTYKMFPKWAWWD